MDTYAHLSKETYNSRPLRKKEINGYTYIKDQSNDNIGVWYNLDKNEYVISHKGTDLNNTEDIDADVSLALGQTRNNRFFERRTRKTKDLVQKIKETDNSAKVKLTGHSLGGSSAIVSMNDPYVNENVDEVITFNPGVSPIKEKFNGSPGKITNHVVKDDPISTNSYHVGKVIHHKGKKDNEAMFEMAGELTKVLTKNDYLKDIVSGLKNHSIDNFLS